MIKIIGFLKGDNISAVMQQIKIFLQEVKNGAEKRA